MMGDSKGRRVMRYSCTRAAADARSRVVGKTRCTPEDTPTRDSTSWPDWGWGKYQGSSGGELMGQVNTETQECSSRSWSRGLICATQRELATDEFFYYENQLRRELVARRLFLQRAPSRVPALLGLVGTACRSSGRARPSTDGTSRAEEPVVLARSWPRTDLHTYLYVDGWTM